MDYKIGIVFSFDKKTGVGYIMTSETIYMFTIYELEDLDIENGDLVRFKGEKVYEKVEKAFFVKKIHYEKKINH